MGTVANRTAGGQGRPLRPVVSNHEELDIRLGRAPYELIPARDYEAVGVGYRTARVFNANKLVVEFDVLVPDAEVESGVRRVRLARFYNVGSGPDDRTLAPPQGAFVREWIIAAGRRPARHDRLSARVFVRVLFSVMVVTVEKNYRQQQLDPLAEYSKVGWIIERRAGGAIG